MAIAARALGVVKLHAVTVSLLRILSGIVLQLPQELLLHPKYAWDDVEYGPAFK